MSDNIPFEIQMEIIKWIPVKPLIQFRSVSKSWKSFIDSSNFIKGYGARHIWPRSHILSLSPGSEEELRHICLVDDDIQTFMVQQQEFAVSPLLEQCRASYVVGTTCHGLLCLMCYNRVYKKRMVVICNPSIQKSFGIALPISSDIQVEFDTVYGFGICPFTSDPTVVKVLCAGNMPWHVEVFTLSSGVWNVIPSGNLPRQSIKLNNSSAPAVIDRFIYWGACEKIPTDDGESSNHMVVSFDLITKEFKVVDLPDSLTNEVISECVFVSKLRDSLVVYGYVNVAASWGCGVWVMERDSYFRKLFSICARVTKILGFTKSGEPICESVGDLRGTGTFVHGGVSCLLFNRLDVYDPCSQQIRNLGISGVGGSFSMGSYKESLLLLDRPDLHIYSGDS